jgi:hypothetical protein
MTLHRSAAAARAPARSPGRKRRSGALSIEISIKLNRGLYCGRDSRAERARSRPATRLRHSPHTTASSTRPAARLGRSVDARTARVDALNQHCCGTTLCCTPYKRRSMRRALPSAGRSRPAPRRTPLRHSLASIARAFEALGTCTLSQQLGTCGAPTVLCTRPPCAPVGVRRGAGATLSRMALSVPRCAARRSSRIAIDRGGGMAAARAGMCATTPD